METIVIGSSGIEEINGHTPEPGEYDGQATYCPEDNKIRLYVGRVPRDEYEALRADGWTSTPKQDCDFVAKWTTSREDTALEYAGYIGDEDQSPEDRAADRAERFAGYRDKRRAEAHGHADTFDAGPAVHGHQSRDRAERAARRHDRQRFHAVNQWSKAEYWQTRTAGVISHALHKSCAHVRRGRILKLEAELRKTEKDRDELKKSFDLWQKVQAEPDAEKAYKLAYMLANYSGCWGRYKHPRADVEYSLYSLLTYEPDKITGHEAAALWLDGGSAANVCRPGSRWARQIDHLKNRLSYERQMLENEGGSAGNVEMVPGGRIGKYLIHKVNKSNATGAVVSVVVMAPAGTFGYNWQKTTKDTLQKVNIQRAGESIYTPPTPEYLEELKTAKEKQKTATQARNAKAPKLINPTPEDAQRLQDAINAKNLNSITCSYSRKNFKPLEVIQMTQAEYSAKSKGTYARYSSYFLMTGPVLRPANSTHWNDKAERVTVCKIRTKYDQIVVITDKPQKPLPCWTMPEEAPKAEPATAGQLF